MSLPLWTIEIVTGSYRLGLLYERMTCEGAIWVGWSRRKPSCLGRFLRGSHHDVVCMVQNRKPEATLAKIAKDSGVHIGTLGKWMRHGRAPAGVTVSESVKLRESRKQNGHPE